ncbi:type II toxin-antitoxin system VapC family toxin [Reyranella sp.]|uniref:type II toxin-antitoxin system VapC family toxin n=1 Tax=Reyranella sp. TaxID=1929291 RepID=UPI003BA99850
MSVVLDTTALLWLLERNDRIGPRAVESIDEALRTSRVMISAASVWEVAVLVAKNRVVLAKSVDQWRIDALQLGIEEVPLDGEVAIESVALADLHADPADRFIVATALRLKARLVTSDAKLLSWKGPLARIDARV